MSKLVIVESPAKAKNIKGYLGKGYDVVASMGHVRDLPAARLSVDIAHDFAPKYAVMCTWQRTLIGRARPLAGTWPRCWGWI